MAQSFDGHFRIGWREHTPNLDSEIDIPKSERTCVHHAVEPLISETRRLKTAAENPV